MKKDDFAVISELYRVLSVFTPSEILSASKLTNISENLRNALVSLHRETVDNAESTVDFVVQQDVDVLSILLDKTMFPTKTEILQVAKLLGVKWRPSVKDSRERLARRLSHLILSKEKYWLDFCELQRSTSQTEGWFELIRKRM